MRATTLNVNENIFTYSFQNCITFITMHSNVFPVQTGNYIITFIQSFWTIWTNTFSILLHGNVDGKFFSSNVFRWVDIETYILMLAVYGSPFSRLLLKRRNLEEMFHIILKVTRKLRNSIKVIVVRRRFMKWVNDIFSGICMALTHFFISFS